MPSRCLSENHGGTPLATTGLYRQSDGWVMVQYDKHAVPYRTRNRYCREWLLASIR